MSGSTSNAGSSGLATTPFAPDSVFNLPLGSNSQWQANGQLSSANVFVNTTASGFNENIYVGTASDPVVTVTNNAGSGGAAGSFQVHIPAGAVPATGGDSTFTVEDTADNTWFSFGGFNWTGSNTATVSQASSEPLNGSGITQDGSDWDEGVGTLTQSDLNSGTIDHMLRMELPPDMLASFSQSSTNILAPDAWPQTQEDGFAINGNGGPAYSGTVPFGVTIGIPAGVAEPAAVASNAGANMLWQALQDHGAMVRDSGGSGNTVIFQTDQNVNPNDPLIQGMDQLGSQIMASAQILSNQGPNSINGGGTPIVPLNGSSGTTTATATPAPATADPTSTTATPAPTATPAADPTTATPAPTATATADPTTATPAPTATATADPTTATPAPTGTATSTPAATPTAAPDPAASAPSGGATGSSTDTSGSGTTASAASSPDSGNATIPPASLSSGSGSGSGMNFIPSPGQSSASASDGSSGGSSTSDPASASAAGLGAAPSGGDFTPPSSSGWSSWHQHGDFGGGHGGCWTAQQDPTAMPAHHFG
jgi:hypothetical protein